MSPIGVSERKTQNRVIDFFQEKLHYIYIGNLHDGENSNIIEDKLQDYLKSRGYSERLIKGAILELKKDSINLQQGIYSANKAVYTKLKYGAKVKEDAASPERNVYFIDFDTPANNDFYIAEEVTIVGNNVKRPDLVIYINGIAVAVIELKRSTVSVAEGIRQNLTNQKSYFIEHFFSTIQFCIAGNESEGVRYGTLATEEKYYLEWKEDGFKEFPEERDETDRIIEEKCHDIEGRLFKDLFCLFYKKRFLDFIDNFIIFDKGKKRVCRYNQYYAIKRAQNRLRKDNGGIIWHTQGSGKSLTMVWLSKWILANNPDARVLIVTDREELDDQIEKLYNGVNTNIVRAKSGRDLINRLNLLEDRLLCSLIHKFGRRGVETKDADYKKYIEELMASLPKDFSAKGKIYVFVDECHRTQSGELHKAMKAILPNALFIGFTGTPLLKKDKSTSLEIFGSYIHTYKFDEGVRDGVVLDLVYEARNIPQDITSQSKIDEWFEIKTQGLTPCAKAKLKAKWGNMQKVFSSKSRLEKIASDIIFDFNTKSRLMDGNGNAILVAGSVYSACKYYEVFQSKGFKKCAIISSYKPQTGDIRTETVSDDEDTEDFEKFEIYRKMLGEQSVEDFETEVKRKFIEEPNNMKLLIVVDKLLTGFDAPPCTYLYIDKIMRDHGLFQAICRVNRLDGETKDFGYIVDYKELFGSLANALNTYTSGAFEDYDEKDIEGLLKNRTETAKKYFLDTLEELEELCEGIEDKNDVGYVQKYFCGENGFNPEIDEVYARVREKLYSLVNKLVRAFAEFKPLMSELGFSLYDQKKFEDKVTYFIELNETIGRVSGDFIDIKSYEPGMRFLIDNYITAFDAEKLGVLDDFTLLDFIVCNEEKLTTGSEKEKESVAEVIENNLRKEIVERSVLNPAYYSKMSEILEQLILDRKKKVISYRQLLEKYKENVSNITEPQKNSRYPEAIRNSAAMRTFFDNCGEDEPLAKALHETVLRARQEGFRHNPAKTNKIKRAIFDILKDKSEVERVFKLIEAQKEY